MAIAIKNDHGFVVGFKGEFGVFENSTAAAMRAGEHNRALREKLAEEGINVELIKNGDGTITVKEITANAGEDCENK